MALMTTRNFQFQEDGSGVGTGLEVGCAWVGRPADEFLVKCASCQLGNHVPVI